MDTTKGKNMDTLKVEADIAKLMEESRKLFAERLKLDAERDKLRAEALKLERDRFLAPLVAGGAIATVAAGLIAAVLRALA